MAWNYRVGLEFLLFALCCQHTHVLKFFCTDTTCRLENLHLNEDYEFAFAYSINTTQQLTAMYITGDVFDLTALPNLSNLRNFVLDNSQLDSVIVRMTAKKSTVTIMNTPLKTIIFHNCRNLREVHIEKTRLVAIPDTLFTQESLEYLFITHSLLTTIDFEQFEKWSNLLFLDLSHNRIFAVHIPPDSTCCRRLLTLDLQQNGLESFNFGLLSHLNCLEAFTLKRNRLLKIENYEPHGKPPTLPQTCADESGFLKEHQKPTPYSRYASLTSINLEGNRLKEVNISMFVNMPHLKELTIGRNMISSIIVTDGQLPMRLEVLDLSFNRLANANLRPIFPVQFLNVGGNQ